MPRKTVDLREAPATKATHVLFILDESGSMGIIRDEAIDGFNEMVNTVERDAKKGGKTTISMWRFGSQDPAKSLEERFSWAPREAYFAKKPKELVAISRETYNPEGNTPMYDAIGQSVTKLEKELDDGGEQTAFLVVVVSDGQENASTEWTGELIAGLVSRLQDTNRWTFAYVGANHDLADVEKHLGIVAGNVMAYTSTSSGMVAASGAVASNLASYMTDRARGATATSNFSQGATDIREEDDKA